MEINGTSGGVATYALKKALEAPEAVMAVVRDAGSGTAGQSLAVKRPEISQGGRAAATGKGTIVDVVA